MRTVISVVLAFVVCTPMALARKWTDSTGKFSVEAEFVEFKDGKVRLKKEDGEIVTVPLEKLSQEDQQFIHSIYLKRNEKESDGSIPSAGEEPGPENAQGEIEGLEFLEGLNLSHDQNAKVE